MCLVEHLKYVHENRYPKHLTLESSETRIIVKTTGNYLGHYVNRENT